MTEEHHIQFIILETNLGFQRKALKVDGEPVATFAIQDGEKVVAAYEYCNIHGFWVNELKLILYDQGGMPPNSLPQELYPD